MAKNATYDKLLFRVRELDIDQTDVNITGGTISGVTIVDHMTTSGILEMIDDIKGDGYVDETLASLASEIAAIESLVLESDVTVTVGPGVDDDFATITDAIKYLNRRYADYVKGGLKAYIELQEDFEMNEQVLVQGLNLGWITIIAASSSEPKSITSIVEGTVETAGVAEISTVTPVISVDKTDLDGEYFTHQDGQGNTRTFYFDATGATPAPVEGAIAVDISDGGVVTVADVLDVLVAQLNTDYGTYITAVDNTSYATITNVDEAACDAITTSDNAVVTVATTVTGVTETYYARFNVTGHGFSTDDELVVKDQVGSAEEQYYNGIKTVTTTDTDWFEIDELYDAVRAGEGGTGTARLLVVIPVKRSACTTLFEYFYRPAFGVARGVLPTIGCLFEMDESVNAHAGHQSYIDGLCATDGGEINILPYAGFRNADATNIYATRASRINANDAIADGAGRHGIWAYSNSIINARRAFVANCGTQDTSYDRGDGWLTAYEPAGCGIIATRGGIVNAEGSTVINTLGDCINACYGGIVNCGNADLNGVIVGGSVNGKNYNSEPGGIITGFETFGRGIIQDGWQPYYDKDGHPGPKYLIAGNKDCGFFGEVTVEELFGSGKDASELITTVGITEGTAQNLTENWLKFAWKGKILFYPKKSIRRSTSWDHIYEKGCVYGTGDTISTAEQAMLDNAEPEGYQTITVDVSAAVDGDILTIDAVDYEKGAAADWADAAALNTIINGLPNYSSTVATNTITITVAKTHLADATITQTGENIVVTYHANYNKLYGVAIGGRVAQTAEITLNGKDYVVRLMKGTQDDPAPGDYGRPGVGLDNEWNRLILPLYYQTYDKDWHRVVDGSDDYSDYVNSVTPDWKTYYTDGDLCTHNSYGNGSYALMQEFTQNDPRRRVRRGLYSASYLDMYLSWRTDTGTGLRLVLEEK